MTSADHMLSRASGIILDFDGPVCSIFAAGENRRIADDLRCRLRDRGAVLPSDVAGTVDPLEVLRYTDQELHEHLEVIEDALIRAEVTAALRAAPTPGAVDLITEWASGLVICSNNSPAAIAAWLSKHVERPSGIPIVGRAYGQPAIMKPHVAPVRQAVELLPEHRRSSVVLIGDSPSDITAAHAAGVSGIGYVKSPDRADALRHAGADALTTTMELTGRADRITP